MPAEAMDHMLDFLDDTGLSDNPAGRVGYVLHGDEVAAFDALSARLNAAVTGDSLEPWHALSAEAGRALDVLRRRS